MVVYIYISGGVKSSVNVEQEQLTYPVLGEERRSDTWYMPLVLPERLEFLCRDTNMQTGGKQREV